MFKSRVASVLDGSVRSGLATKRIGFVSDAQVSYDFGTFTVQFLEDCLHFQANSPHAIDGLLFDSVPYEDISVLVIAGSSFNIQVRSTSHSDFFSVSLPIGA